MSDDSLEWVKSGRVVSLTIKMTNLPILPHHLLISTKGVSSPAPKGPTSCILFEPTCPNTLDPEDFD